MAHEMSEKGEKTMENGDEDEDDYFDAEDENMFLKSSKKRSRKPSREGLQSKPAPVIDDEKPRDSCPDYFGVKSYLHNFYDADSYENPNGEDDFRYLVAPKRRHCDMSSSFCWKLVMWSGINFVILGTIAILVGYLVPKRQVVVGEEEYLEIIDRGARKFNANLDLCKLVGLVVFCVGGALVMMSLMCPGLTTSSTNSSDDGFGLKIGSLDPRSPTDVKIPITEEVLRIQPQLD